MEGLVRTYDYDREKKEVVITSKAENIERMDVKTFLKDVDAAQAMLVLTKKDHENIAAELKKTPEPVVMSRIIQLEKDLQSLQKKNFYANLVEKQKSVEGKIKELEEHLAGVEKIKAIIDTEDPDGMREIKQPQTASS